MVDQQYVAGLQRELLALKIADWYDKVSSWQWALVVLLLIVPWIIWWKYVDRKNVSQILVFGLIVALLSSFLNANGLNLLLWSYPYRLLPFSDRLYSVSYTVIPVIMMFLYQFFPGWRPFTASLVVTAAVIAFVAQPVLAAMGMYKIIQWNYFYSFLTLIFIGVSSRFTQQALLKEAVGEKQKTKRLSRFQGLAAPRKKIK